jgi:monoamine oxidase
MTRSDKDREPNQNAATEEGSAGSRRKFLKLMGSASVAAVSLGAQMRGATPPQARTNSPTALDKVTQVDVVVIGGGFAGTTAARECCQAGLRTVLLEARNRLGGRTFYTKFGDDPVELGGTWIHWFQPNVWAELLHYGLDIDETPGFTSPEKIMWLSGDKLVDPSLEQATATFADGMKKFNEDAAKIFPRPYDTFFNPDLVKKYDGMSIMDRINQLNLPKEQEDLVIAMQELCASASCKDSAYLDMVKWWALSGNDLWLMNDILARFHFKQGTISLINAMVDDA